VSRLVDFRWNGRAMSRIWEEDDNRPYDRSENNHRDHDPTNARPENHEREYHRPGYCKRTDFGPERSKSSTSISMTTIDHRMSETTSAHNTSDKTKMEDLGNYRFFFMPFVMALVSETVYGVEKTGGSSMLLHQNGMAQ